MNDYFYRSLYPNTSFSSDAKISYHRTKNALISKSEHKNKTLIHIPYSAISELTFRAFNDIAFYFRDDHLKALQKIAMDKETTENDRFVAKQLLKNAVISASGIFPSCQDTGTAIIIAWKGEQVWTFNDQTKTCDNHITSDYHAITKGVYDSYQSKNLRYSQLAALSMFEEKNTKTNLPCDIKIYSNQGPEYKFLFIAKGGGSANKTFLFQKSKALLNEANLSQFLTETLKSLGTAACPPYHLAVVIGGLSAEQNLNTVKLATCRFLDNLDFNGNLYGQAFRDKNWEQKINEIAKNIGIGAQFGGDHFIHSTRVIRLPRHAASLVVGIGVSCSADRQILAKINENGIYLENLQKNPSQYLVLDNLDNQDNQTKNINQQAQNKIIKLDLNQPMNKLLIELDKYPVGTRLSLSGILVVARDVAHAKVLEKLKSTNKMSKYFKDHPIYYAGPAKTPDGYVSGSFGPTTSQRMDPYVEIFQSHGGSMIMLGKGNRSLKVVKSCYKYKGFYLGSIGGPGAIIGKDYIKSKSVLDYQNLGMEAIWSIEVQNFPAFIITDNKGNDLFLGNISNIK